MLPITSFNFLIFLPNLWCSHTCHHPQRELALGSKSQSNLVEEIKNLAGTTAIGWGQLKTNKPKKKKHDETQIWSNLVLIGVSFTIEAKCTPFLELSPSLRCYRAVFSLLLWISLMYEQPLKTLSFFICFITFLF